MSVVSWGPSGCGRRAAVALRAPLLLAMVVGLLPNSARASQKIPTAYLGMRTLGVDPAEEKQLQTAIEKRLGFWFTVFLVLLIGGIIIAVYVF